MRTKPGKWDGFKGLNGALIPKGSDRPKTAKKRGSVKAPSVAMLDAAFSKFIRAYFGLACFTCGSRKSIQCGHYITRRFYSVRWTVMNARPQCAYCNCWKHGEAVIFRKRLVEIFGEDEIAKMEALSRMQGVNRKPRPYEAVEILSRIKADLAALKTL